MNTTNSLVSVVTPVHNGEKHLVECIESVLCQTYGNLEYVIVNNASTDDTAAICQRFAEQDSRIRIVTNGTILPLLENWNHALRQIDPASQHTKVVHADDLLFPECVERMVELAAAHPSVGVVAAYRIDGARVNLDTVPYPLSVLPGRDICRRRLLGGGDPFGSPSSTMIRSDHIRARDNFYNLDNLHADTEACFDVLRESDYGFVHQVLTFTRRHAEAETTYARRMGTHHTGRLYMARKFASDFLDATEQRKAIALQQKFYYRFLARNILGLGNREFRRFQTQELAKAGEVFSLAKLLKAAAVEFGLRALRAAAPG